MKFSTTAYIITALASLTFAAPVVQESESVTPRGIIGGMVGGALSLAGGITSAAGANTVGQALSGAGGIVSGAGAGAGAGAGGRGKGASRAAGGRGKRAA